MDKLIDDESPSTQAVLNFINECLQYGPIRGMIFPINWVLTLAEENPAWGLDKNTKSFMMNGILVKVYPKESNVLYSELIDSRENRFNRFTP